MEGGAVGPGHRRRVATGAPCPRQWQSLWAPSPMGSTGLSMHLRPEPESATFLTISGDLNTSTPSPFPRDVDQGNRTQASTALKSYEFIFDLIL